VATTRSDIQSLLAQPPSPSLPPRRDRAVESRWQEWLPFCTVEARRHSDPSNHLHSLRVRHRSRLVACLSASLAWDTIREHRLDSPVVSDAEFNFLLRCAIERRRCRMGRVKGQSKNPKYHLKQAKYPSQGGRS
jgi:hypothetical protein